MRKYGATVDNLLSVDLVTADGELVTASENENPDLFWGVRGGGGNFGIVTSFEYRLHPVGPIVLAGPIFHHLDDARKVLRFYREFAASAPQKGARRSSSTTARAATADPARGRPRQADSHGGRLLRRVARGRGRGRPAAQGVRRPDRRPAQAQAVPGAAVDARPPRAARLAPLLEVGRAPSPLGRTDRQRHLRRRRRGLRGLGRLRLVQGRARAAHRVLAAEHPALRVYAVDPGDMHAHAPGGVPGRGHLRPPAARGGRARACSR